MTQWKQFNRNWYGTAVVHSDHVTITNVTIAILSYLVQKMMLFYRPTKS